jgi:hypothetical protein
MEIVLELHELKNICKDMAEQGMVNAIKLYHPKADEIKRREAQEWLVIMGYDMVLLDKLESNGLIAKPVRKGKGKNSPLYYSKSDIISALNSVKWHKYINKP